MSQKRKQEIVYVLGLSHVGSTLIDLMLGSQPKFIGLGEVFQVANNDLNVLSTTPSCSCGVDVDECVFWRPAVNRITNAEGGSTIHRYNTIINVFNEVFGRQHVLVDSSKRIEPLKYLLNNGDYNVRIIYIIRDVRAWTISRLDTSRRFPNYYTLEGNYIKRLRKSYGKKIDLVKWMVPLLTRMASYFFMLWYIQNRQIKKFLMKNKLDYLQIGYDELTINPSTMTEIIFEYLDISEKPTNLSTERSKSHIIIGSVGKSDPKRRSGIYYDARWMYRSDWLNAAVLLRKIMRYNNNQVYRNLRKVSI